MSTLTSTLSLRVDDAGFAAKLKADADAAKALGMSAKDLERLKVGAGTSKMVADFERLTKASARLDGFAAASKGLDGLGERLRGARSEVAKTSRALVAAERKSAFFDRSKASGSSNYPGFLGSGAVAEAATKLKTARRANAAALRAAANVEDAFTRQRTAVRAAGQEIERAGTPLASVARAQRQVRAEVEAVTASIRRQVAAHEAAGAAAASSAVETRRQATAQLRATVQGAEATRADRDGQARQAAAQARRDSRNALKAAIQQGNQARQAREAAEADETSRRANAGRDMARGMGGAGRRQRDDMEGGRRVADGMSAPGRAARARARAEADAADAEREEMRAARTASRRDAAGVLAGAASIRAATTGKRIAADAIASVAEFDIASRKQRVFTDIGDGDQATLRAQAKRIGQETQFSNVDVVKAQTASMQGLPASFLPTLKAQVAEGIVENVRDYATLMETDLKEGAETIRSYLQAAGKDISTREKALSESNLATNQLVKMAKLGGMDGSDVAQFVKFAAAPGTSSGLSTDTMLSLGALARRGGLRGDEAGVFMRATAAKLVSPTTKGVAALNAAGVNYSDYVKMPDRLSTDLLENQFKTSTGKSFTPEVRQKVEAVNSDKSLVADRAKYTAAITAAVSDILGKQKDGTVRASDARVASKAAGDFHKVSAKSVNSEGLLDAVMSRDMTLAQLNAFLTDKHGGKGAITARQWEEFRASRQQIKAAGDDPNMASGKSKEVMGGVGGSVENLRGSVDNAKLALGEAWAGPIQSLADGMGTAVDSFSKMPTAAQQATSALGGLATAGAGLWGTFALAGALLGKGGAGAGAGTAGAGLAAGAAGVGAAGVGTLGIGAAAAYIAAKQMPAIIDERGAAGFDAATGFTPDANPMAGMAPEKPWAAEWLKKKLPSVFGQREGSLPPGTAGMPPAPVPRLPGLDGRPKAAVARQGDATMGGSGTMTMPSGAEGSIARLNTQVDEARTKVQAIGAQTVTPHIDASSIEAVLPKADAAKASIEGLNVTARPTVDAGSIAAAEAAADRLLAKLAQIGASAAGASNAIRSIPSPSGAIHGRSSGSFSDGVTPGAGAQ